jgi:hypothetical protein
MYADLIREEKREKSKRERVSLDPYQDFENHYQKMTSGEVSKT